MVIIRRLLRIMLHQLDHFEVLAKGRSDTHCKIKETLLIKDLKPTLNEYVSSERLCLYFFFFITLFVTSIVT